MIIKVPTAQLEAIRGPAGARLSACLARGRSGTRTGAQPSDHPDTHTTCNPTEQRASRARNLIDSLQVICYGDSLPSPKIGLKVSNNLGGA